MESCCGVYRPRNPRATPLHRLLEGLYEKVKGLWDEAFEPRYGFWRAFVEQAVFRYLDCGVFEQGFARIRCRRCADEYLVAFSCKGRGLCPSCGAKRGAAFGAFLADEVVEEVGHTHWVFTIPKMLRPYFMHHRELLGGLAGAAHETLREIMAAAAGEGAGFQIGMVAVVQTFGGMLNVHPHVHALASRGGWDRTGTWLPVPYLDEGAAEQLFRHEVIKLLRDAGLLNEKRIELLLSWRHSGFAVRGETHVGPTDRKAVETVARHMLRCPVSLARLAWREGAATVAYKGPPDEAAEEVDACELVARALAHVPDPRRHLVRYYGAYSNVARGKRKKSCAGLQPADEGEAPEELSRAQAARRRSWAEPIRRVYEVDPLVCPKCGGEMRVVAFVTEARVIKKILDHLARRAGGVRAEPTGGCAKH
jgi:hypothetical protein